jgi:hypothetical protein
MAHRCRIAPVLYECLRRVSMTMPADALGWFRVQYYQTVARNMALHNELARVLGWLSEASIPAILLKGPALAQLGLGVVRVSTDLDILVHDTDVRSVDAILSRNGYKPWPGRLYDYHARYSRATGTGSSVLEIHFDISDRPRSFKPDIAAIWDRSQVVAISDLPVRVPDLTDHILLTIMQLPHHHWETRLIVDLWRIALRWGGQVDWFALVHRARGWRMSALTRSTLYSLVSMYDVALPEALIPAIQPVGYFERVQWKAAGLAMAEHLEHPLRPRMMLLAPFLLVDRASSVPAILMRRALGLGGSPEESPLSKATRRNAAMAATLPAVARLLVTSLSRAPKRG